MILELYDNTKTYMYPSGRLATPAAVAEKYPAVAVFAHVVGTDEAGQVMFSLENLSAMRTRYGISRDLTVPQAIAALQQKLDQEAAPRTDAVTAEERIAAALEAQVLLTMPEEVTEQ